MDENKLNTILQTSLENLKKIVDVNTVVGEAIRTDSGTVIIPVSKVSMGFASGGTDFLGRQSADKKNFAGGGGTGVTLLPLGFLVIKPSGDADFISVEGKSAPSGGGKLDSIFGFIEKTPDIVSKYKDIFAKQDNGGGDE